MIRCVSVSSYMGPYISNYILSELALERKFKDQGDVLVHVFPKDVEDKEWVCLFREIDAKLYFVEYKPGTLQSVRTLRKIIRDEEANIIHCHFGGWDLDAKLAAPFITTIWHQRMFVNLDTRKRRIKYWLKYNILGMFRTRNIAISEAVYEAITSITNKKTYCIPDCIDFNRVQIDFEQRLKEKKNGEPCRILLFGYSPLVKGLDVAYKACELLASEGYRIELDVVSQSESDRYIAEHYQLQPSWFKVLSPISNVSEYYNKADVFLSASRSEGFSNSLLEAIYCGCPAVYSDIAGTRWAADFAHTVKYAVESPEALAKAILLCTAIPVSQEEIMINREKAVANYSMEAWIEKIYQVLVESHKS